MDDIRFKRNIRKVNIASVKTGEESLLRHLPMAAALVVGGMLTKSENILSLTKTAGKQLSNFRLVERDNEVALHDRNGDEILVVEKNA